LQSAFKDITKLKLPFPLHFQLRSSAHGGASKPTGAAVKSAAAPKVSSAVAALTPLPSRRVAASFA
jgi:hypothetical protein